MKIKQIELKKYKQFKDLTLDLTYPKGHKKEGQPLDKICIIGQSGTGKTNLLEVIRDTLFQTEVKTTFIEENDTKNEKMYFSNIDKICPKSNQKDIDYMNRITNNIKEFLLEKAPVFVLSVILYLVVHLIEFFVVVVDKRLEIIIKLLGAGLLLFFIVTTSIVVLSLLVGLIMSKLQYMFKITNKYVKNKYYIELDENSWHLLKERIGNHHQERLEFTNKLSNKLLNIENYKKSDFQLEMKEWEKNNENILDSIAYKLNKFLIKFNIQLIKIDKNQKSYDDLIFKDLSNENIIKYENLSTGTKNLIATFIPLKIHNPKDSIILIDEPENSFYPDIQRKLTELYMEAGENNQVIFATHSPIIASSFEPWEVVELKFDKNNQVYRELYYEGENHVDNYTLDPRMLTWTGILTDIFDLKEDSNFAFREKKLMEYATLKAKIKIMNDAKEKEEAFRELQQIGKHLGLYNQK